VKQHINSEQLKELTFEQINMLGKVSGLLSYPQTEEEWLRNKEKQTLTMYISLLKWINIGNMIEMLKEDLYKIAHEWIDGVGKVWELELVGIYGESRYIHKEELTDVLWEAVRELIKTLK